MADKRIADFPTLEQAQDTDLILVSSQEETYNITFATLKEGTHGDPGTGISSYTDYYAVNNSTTPPADSAFSTTVVNPTQSNRYLWGYTEIQYTDLTELITDKHILGVYGERGDTGYYVTNITNYYLRSANKTGVTRSTSGWSTTVPELTETYPYMWSYTRFTMSSGSYQYSTPCVVGSLGNKGVKGDTGKSAYQAAVEQGYSGTEAQFGTEIANAGTYASTANTKAQEAAQSATNAANSAASITSALSNYYTKTQTDDLLDDKANTSAVYTKTETDALLNAKADASAVYTKTQTDDLLNAKADTSALLDLLYPVGSIYLSTNSVNPSTFFGGTWEAYAAGRVLVGVDPNDTDFDTAGNTGGEKKHTLTVNEMPSHNHRLANAKTGGSGTARWTIESSGASTAQIESTGGGQAHNNLQPYITCHMWLRTA